MIKRKKIYITSIIILLLVAFNKIGFYDSSSIKVDNFIIKKPFLYRNVSGQSSFNLGEYSSTTIMFSNVFTHKSILYSFRKVIDKKKFEIESEFSLKMKQINISHCYISKKDIQIDIYSYPYTISFNEINNVQEEKMIQQVCHGKQIIDIPSH